MRLVLYIKVKYHISNHIVQECANEQKYCVTTTSGPSVLYHNYFLTGRAWNKFTNISCYTRSVPIRAYVNLICIVELSFLVISLNSILRVRGDHFVGDWAYAWTYSQRAVYGWSFFFTLLISQQTSATKPTRFHLLIDFVPQMPSLAPFYCVQNRYL